MKEATGELNATVFVVIFIAGLVAFFYFSIWPAIRNNINEGTACSKAICPKENYNASDGTVECYTMENGQRSEETITCVWKG